MKTILSAALLAACLLVPGSRASSARAQAHAGTRPKAHSRPLARVTTADSLNATRVVLAFHAAVERGDSVAALALLAPDVSVVESGEVEKLAAFRSHHLGEDIAFARAVPSVTGPLDATVAGDVAWVVSTSSTHGTFNGRTINSIGAELMVLSRTATNSWQIRAIHWSSRRRT